MKSVWLVLLGALSVAALGSGAAGCTESTELNPQPLPPEDPSQRGPTTGEGDKNSGGSSGSSGTGGFSDAGAPADGDASDARDAGDAAKDAEGGG